VLVHRLVARETVEERVLELQERKRGLLQAAVGEGAGLALSREEILELVS
jgi:SNF2 family DNA or RNA helicase